MSSLVQILEPPAILGSNLFTRRDSGLVGYPREKNGKCVRLCGEKGRKGRSTSSCASGGGREGREGGREEGELTSVRESKSSV